MKPRPKAPKHEEYIAQPDVNLIQVLRLSSTEANRMDRYLSWDELRYRKAPEGLDTAGWWIGLKLHRMQARINLPLQDKKGVPFSYTVTRMMQALLQQIDMQGGGTLQTKTLDILSAADRNRYLMTSLMDEAIMSSLLEGAAVTRAEARNLLSSNRRPTNEHERMITNNYLTMQLILNWKDDELTPARVLSLHRSMTEGTLPQAGTLRTEADKVRIEATVTGEVIHVPPAAEELPARLQALCDFANNKTGEYIHPVLQAIVLHFWLAYDHPFVDGNGRTARALFYWAMLKAGYWLFEYISISHTIYRHAKAYYQAFTNTEEDDNDLNYFLTNQLCAIRESINDLQNYLMQRIKEQKQLDSQLNNNQHFNHRQKALLTKLLKAPETAVSVNSHCLEYRTVRQTARTDLNMLAKAGLLTVQKIGKEFIYKAVPDIAQRISHIG